MIRECCFVLTDDNVENLNGCSTKIFKNLYDICSENLFTFNKMLHMQTDGASMGGCVSPKLAEIFMSCYMKPSGNKTVLQVTSLFYENAM